MAIATYGQDIRALYYGTRAIISVYLGTILVWGVDVTAGLYHASLDFSDARNSMYSGQVV